MGVQDIVNYIKLEKILNQEKITNEKISGISFDSRKITNGDVFVCIVGEHSDGHDFAEKAVKNGACCVISEKELNLKTVPVLVVKSTQDALAQASAVIYGFPAKNLNLIGVTGTNGKTTVTHLIQAIFEKAGKSCGLVGTLGNRYSSDGEYITSGHTTPQASDLQKVFRAFVDKNIHNAVMEVSSHAIEQKRIAEVEFNGAVITNLTQDHLDYHITMENYFHAKSKLFSNLKSDESCFAIINNDDAYAEKFISAIPNNVKIYTYGINKKSDILAKDIEFSVYGSKFTCVTEFASVPVNLQMTGLFSIYNALAALSACIASGIALNTCIQALEETPSVAGRFEVVSRKPLVIVDYAHTPDGLENVLKTAREIVPEGGSLISVFGCGGDRDATKRPKMGRISENLADKTIITSDNPRSEDPQQIITDILSGIKSLNSNIIVEIDRQRAIETAVKIAKDNDVIMLAGKGHEDYQILNGETIHFDDREEARKALAQTGC